MRRVFFILFISCFFLFPCTEAQQLYRGIVVDSLKLTNIPDVHVSVKRSGKITSTSQDGSFMIYASPTDTILFSAIGYVPLELPLLFQEPDMFVLLQEDRIWLQEVIIRSTRLYPNYIEDRTKAAPQKMSKLEAFNSPFDYFSGLEREKRKLSKIIEENNRTQTFRQVITDPDVKEIMMKEHEVSEELYYQVIVKFNQQQSHVHYFTDPDKIMEALHSFFENETGK
jgi:hypothetical protein